VHWQRLLPALIPGAFLVLLFAWLIGVPAYVGASLARRDRRRILSKGRTAEGLVSRVIPRRDRQTCRIEFHFQPEGAAHRQHGEQMTTRAAVERLGLGEASVVSVCYLPRRPRAAFIRELIVAERTMALNAHDPAAATSPPLVEFVSFRNRRTAGQPAAAFRWSGSGEITIGGASVLITTQQMRAFWFPKPVTLIVARDQIANVEAVDEIVRCELQGRSSKPGPVTFQAVNAAAAQAIASRLPATRTASFAPVLAEGAEFAARLLEVAPHAPVTPVLVGANVAIFLIGVYLGAGVWVPDPEVLIRMGSDYTPLTASGQWWRLLTSTFLHFGIMHLAFNMLALWVNGRLVERLYGSTRYLVIYLVAGLSGSVVSFLWHPLVNAAGASGAIFGVLGALFAFFLRSPQGVPPTVRKTQLRTAGVFIAYSLLNAARIRGVDNAAHLGGVIAGLVLGLLLARPLEKDRDERSWATQWLTVGALLGVVGFALAHALSTGQLGPRALRDAQGHLIPFSALEPRRSLWGLKLGMAADEVRRIKGTPLRQHGETDWVYNAIDDAHDGALDVYFDGARPGPGAIRAILYVGEPNSSPPELPPLIGRTREELVHEYGEPIGSSPAREGEDWQYLYFLNGVTTLMLHGKTFAYGVYRRTQ